MMINVRKALVFVSLFSFLLATTTASVYAFSMSGIDDSMSPAVVMSDQEVGMVEDCHTPSTPPCAQSESSSCKIFCAVMAQAIAQADNAILSVFEGPLLAPPFLSKIFSHQLSVEPHPPKQYS